jgi:adenylate cyclase
MGIRALGGLEAVELRAWDQWLRWRPAHSVGAPRTVSVLMDEADIARFGHPLPDGLLASLLRGLLDAGATAVGVDLYRDRPVEPGHAAFRELVLTEDRVVLVEKLPAAGSPGVAAPDFLPPDRAARQVGFADLVVDDDGVVRRSLLFAWDASGTPHASLALQLALHHLADLGLGIEPDPGRPEHLALGAGWLVPLEGDEGGYVGADARGYQILLDYAGAASERPSVTLGDWLDGRAPDDFARGRVVVVGTRAPSVRDDFLTPVGDAAPAPSGRAGAHPLGLGVAVHAEAVDQLLRVALDGQSPPSGWAPATTAAAAGLLALVGAALAVGVRSPWAVGGAWALLLGLGLGAAWAAAVRGVWAPWPSLALAGVLASVAGWAAVSQRERRARQRLQQLFGRYLPGEVVDHLQRHRDRFLVNGRPRPQRLVETILMIDVEDSSRAAEQMDSGAFLAWIDRGLGALARAAEHHGGIVEYFSGDGLKVDFGVPMASHDPAGDARAAVGAALEGARVLAGLNAEAEAEGRPRMRVRMGIHSGETVAGAIGSESRLQYTTLGAAANLAARLEAFDKELHRGDPTAPDCRILVSEATRRLLDAAASGADPSWCWRAVGHIAGPDERRGQTLEVFELRSHDRSGAGEP